MKRQFIVGSWLLITAVAIGCQSLIFTPVPVHADQPASVAGDWVKLADEGRFEELLKRVESADQVASVDEARTLVASLQRYQQNESHRQEQRREAYREALERLNEHVEASRYEDALVAAIEAHGLADEPSKLLKDELVSELVRRVEQAIEKSEQDHDWLQVFTYYRLVDLLFEEDGRYREDFKRSARHLRVLQFYAPLQLQQLVQQRRDRRQAAGNDQDQPQPLVRDADIEPDSWQTRLGGIRRQMLSQTLQHASTQHINQPGYLAMVRGSVESVLILLQTQAIEQTFEGLRDEQKRQRFITHLTRLKATLEQPGKTLTAREADQIITGIIDMNQATVNLPEQVIIFELTEGATNTLDDFSSVIWPEDLAQFSRSTQGKFFGVGIQLSRRDGRLLVVSPLPNTPAQSAGVKAGDIIVTVDGRDTASWSLDKAVREITGPEGTKVTLGLERVGHTDPLEFELTRAEIIIESVQGWRHRNDGTWDFWIDPDSRIGYVRLTQFVPQTADDLDKAIEQMQRQGRINGLILDLRFNPGGLLSSAIDITDRFVSEGPIVYTVDGQGQRTSRHFARKARTYEQFPLVVLINRASASASEIVSGAVQDYHRGLIVGQRTFGKGSVQDVRPLDFNRAFFKLTTQHYQLPQGRIIHREPNSDVWGIEPDLIVPMTEKQIAAAIELRQDADVLRDEEELDQMRQNDEEIPNVDDLLVKGLDPQLEAAVLVLQTRLVAGDHAVAQKP